MSCLQNELLRNSWESSDADIAASVEDCTLRLQTPKEKGTETCKSTLNPHPHFPNLPFNLFSSFFTVMFLKLWQRKRGITWGQPWPFTKRTWKVLDTRTMMPLLLPDIGYTESDASGVGLHNFSQTRSILAKTVSLAVYPKQLSIIQSCEKPDRQLSKESKRVTDKADLGCMRQVIFVCPLMGLESQLCHMPEIKKAPSTQKQKLTKLTPLKRFTRAKGSGISRILIPLSSSL